MRKAVGRLSIGRLEQHRRRVSLTVHRRFFSRKSTAQESDVQINFDKNYYAALGVSPTADVKSIRKAYHQSALKYHPDRTLHLPQSQARKAAREFREISEAYRILADDSLRNVYDESSKHVEVLVDDYTFDPYYSDAVNEKVRENYQLFVEKLPRKKVVEKPNLWLHLGAFVGGLAMVLCGLQALAAGGQDQHWKVYPCKPSEEETW